jgi:hypothetical protein
LVTSPWLRGLGSFKHRGALTGFPNIGDHYVNIGGCSVPLEGEIDLVAHAYEFEFVGQIRQAIDGFSIDSDDNIADLAS